MLKLDRIDRHILTLMQQDGRISNLDLAEKVGLSPSPCSRRVKALEDEGLILNHVTLLNPERLNLKLTAHIHVTVDKHTPERLDNFNQAISQNTRIKSALLVLWLNSARAIKAPGQPPSKPIWCSVFSGVRP